MKRLGSADQQFQRHLTHFIAAYNFGRRLKTLKGLTPYEFICKRFSVERTVDFRTFGPVGSSATEVRIFHFATVFGLIPCRLASVLRLS